MISYLKGTILNTFLNSVTLLVAGVGYKVTIPASLLSQVKIGTEASYFIHTNVQENAIDLYGFLKQEDLALFELLITVSGVGPKTAMGVFSIGNSDEIKSAIVKGDTLFFKNVPRLGNKNSQKIIIELRSKLGNLENINVIENSEDSEAVYDALKKFGFTSHEIQETLNKIPHDADVTEKVRQSLKILGKR